MSSATYLTSLGGATAYDSACNTLASAAGINNSAGTAYIAWISDFFSTARMRLGVAARGWVRTDGKPFADSQSTLFNNTSNAALHSLRITEAGVDVGTQPVMTGTDNDGTAGASSSSYCTNWTGTGTMVIGNAAYGAGGWSNTGLLSSCTTASRIYCLMRTMTTTLVLPPPVGKADFSAARIL